MLRELQEKRGYEVVAVSSPGKAMEEIATHEGVRTAVVPMERHISLRKDIVSLCRMIKLFRREAPTMVHSITPKAGMLSMLAAWLTRVPVRVHTFTGLVFPTSSGLKRRLLMATDWLTCACATHIIPEGEGVKNDLLSYGITRKPLRVLGYGNIRGVDMEHYSRRPEVMTRAGELRDESKITFLFVGRIVRDKGVDELCEAFARQNARYPRTRLWLIGSYEDKLDPISEEARRIINTCPAVEAVGRKSGDELLAYYAAADCLVCPSYREGFPNVVLEAGALDLPSIVTDINGSREIIIEGENGTIVSPRDADALHDAMERMVNDADYRFALARNARQQVCSRFEQGFVRQCLYDFYDEVLKNQGICAANKR